MPADVLAPVGARASASTVMTVYGALVYMGLHLEGFKQVLVWWPWWYGDPKDCMFIMMVKLPHYDDHVDNYLLPDD